MHSVKDNLSIETIIIKQVEYIVPDDLNICSTYIIHLLIGHLSTEGTLYTVRNYGNLIQKEIYGVKNRQGKLFYTKTSTKEPLSVSFLHIAPAPRKTPLQRGEDSHGSNSQVRGRKGFFSDCVQPLSLWAFAPLT